MELVSPTTDVLLDITVLTVSSANTIPWLMYSTAGPNRLTALRVILSNGYNPTTREYVLVSLDAYGEATVLMESVFNRGYLKLLQDSTSHQHPIPK